MTRKQYFLSGLKDGMPICFGYFAVSFAFGIQAAGIGLSVFEASVLSALNVTSAGQFAALAIIASGASLIELAFTQLIINLRYFLMSCALSQKLSPSLPLGHRLGIAYGMTDEIFAVSVSQREPLSPFYSYGLIAVAIPGWVLGTALGAAAGNILPPVKIANGIWEFLKKLTDGFQATDPADAALSSNADWWALIQLIILVWAIFKIFFSNLKRGGILLVQICVGSMHMLALARGYTDGFGSWCKQVVALCFTAFVQNLLYLLAIIMMQDAASSSLYFSLGLLLVAAEVPRIAQMFGLDTSARVSLGNAAHNVSSVVSLVKQFA